MNYLQLLKKYDVPVPRYTSYPPVPFWDPTTFSADRWLQALKKSFTTSPTQEISLYIHLPFCERLCTYCACNTRITKNHAVEEKYIDAVLSEWALYQDIFQNKAQIRELHLGGGTPTFFSASNLEKLLKGIFGMGTIHPAREFSFEGHPNNTTLDHLATLHRLGFRRVSFGVQDLSEKVQRAIHRIQPFENVETVVHQSKQLGYESVNIDLIYGLPFQTVASVEQTMMQVLSLKPDRIAFYSYAHVPWLKPGQRGYEDSDLPGDVKKRALYETGRNILSRFGYQEIGMDHFALPDDSLSVANSQGKLHRNFMGYTTTHTDFLIGLGTSAISEAPIGYSQNEKVVEKYTETIHTAKLPIIKGHLHHRQDLVRKNVIASLICNGFAELELIDQLSPISVDRINEMTSEGIIEITDSRLVVTDTGKAFVRNICAAFDGYAAEKKEATFSKAI